jgi:hypothetical protein
MDDVVAVMDVRTLPHLSQHLAHRTYPTSLNLKLEHLGSSVPFLESELFLVNCGNHYQILSRWLNKNRSQIIFHQPTKIIRFIPPQGAPSADKKYLTAILFNIFLKIDKFLIIPASMQHLTFTLLYHDVSLILEELERLGFAKGLLIATLKRFTGCRTLYHLPAWIQTFKTMQKAMKARGGPKR